MSTRIVRFAIQWVLALVVAANLVAADASDGELQAAVRAGDHTRLQALIARDGGPSSNTATLLLIWAAADGNRPVLEKLLAAGVPINAISSRSAWVGETALMGAVTRRQKDTVAYLLQKGANPNAVGQSSNGSSTRYHLALFGAVNSGDLDIARTLLRARADPNLVGAYAVSLANKQGDIEMYNLLLQHGGRLPAPALSKQPPVTAAPAGEAEFKALGFAELLPGAAGASKTAAVKQRQRLAIVADDLNVAAADLLVARLSKHPRFELVERQELDRVLAEQKLSKQFAADAANFRQVATFLRADVLALIRTRKVAGLEVVETRFVRVDAGIVLDTSYRPAPLALANWVEEMAQRAGDVAERVTRPNAIAVSMLDVHATVRTAAARPLERTLTLLLRERLVRDPQFAVLERTELAKVAFEQNGSFWTGSYLLEPSVDVALDNTGTFKLTLQLKPAGQGKPITLSADGQRSDPTRAIDELMKQMRGQLALAGAPPAPNRVAEANRFIEEARWALAAEMPGRAHTAAETAWAFGDHTIETARLRVQSAFGAVRESASRRMKSDGLRAEERLDLAIHGVGVWRDLLESELVRGKPQELRRWLESADDMTDAAMLAIIALPNATDQIPHAEKLRTLREAHQAALHAAFSRAVELSATAPRLANEITMDQTRSLRIMVRDRVEFLAAARELFSRHFAVDDVLTRAKIRTEFSWDRAKVILPTARTGIGDGKTSCLPPEHDVRDEFAKFLRSSGAPEDRFMAWSLEASELPRKGETAIEHMWGMRDLLARDGKAFGVYFFQYEALLSEMHFEGQPVPTYSVQLDGVSAAPLQITRNEFHRRLYLHVLDHAPVAGREFQRLLAVRDYSPEQFAEVEAAYGRYCVRTGANFGPLPRPGRLVSRSTVPTNPPTPQSGIAVATPAAKAAAPTVAPLLVRRFWSNADDQAPKQFTVATHTLQWVENRLWFYGAGVNYDKRPAELYQCVFALDFATGKVERFPLPRRRYVENEGVDCGMVVTSTRIAFARKNGFFAAFDRGVRKWDIFEDIKPTHGIAPVVVDDAAYLIAENASAVIRLDMKQRTSRTLVSTRRRPGESPLDITELWLSRIWKNENGEVVIAGETDPLSASQSRFTLAAWNPAEERWRTLQEAKLKSETTLPAMRANLPLAGQVTGRNAVFNALNLTTAQPRAKENAPLTLNFSTPVAGKKEIPIDFRLPPGLEPGRSYDGVRSMINVGPCLATPAGYVFPFSMGGPGFWFLTKAEFEAYNAPPQAARPTQ